jgi:hypothetical protein
LVAAVLYDYPQVRRWLFRRFAQSGVETLAGPLLGDYGYQRVVQRLARQLVGGRRRA